MKLCNCNQNTFQSKQTRTQVIVTRVSGCTPKNDMICKWLISIQELPPAPPEYPHSQFHYHCQSHIKSHSIAKDIPTVIDMHNATHIAVDIAMARILHLPRYYLRKILAEKPKLQCPSGSTKQMECSIKHC